MTTNFIFSFLYPFGSISVVKHLKYLRQEKQMTGNYIFLFFFLPLTSQNHPGRDRWTASAVERIKSVPCVCVCVCVSASLSALGFGKLKHSMMFSPITVDFLTKIDG